MAKAKKPKQLAPADQRRLAEFLAGVHARLRFWRMCRRQACRRRRSCGGDVEACGARSVPKHWKWMDHFVQSVRDGVSRRAAVRAADQQMLPKRLIVDHGFGKPTEFVVNDDGSWTLAERAPPRFQLDMELKRLAGSAFLCAAPEGKAKR